MRWRIYYGDGSTYGPDAEPQFAPTLNAQVVAWDDPLAGRQTARGFDYYVWNHAEAVWYGCERFGLFDHLAHTEGWQKVLFGRTIPTVTFKAVVRRAIEEAW